MCHLFKEFIVGSHKWCICEQLNMKVDIDYSINGVSKIVLFDNFTRLILFDA